jgi:hypothetical protein
MPLKHLISWIGRQDMGAQRQPPSGPIVDLDFNAENQVVGVEILHLSKRAPGLEARKLVFETAPAAATR